MKKIILSKPFILIILLSFFFYTTAPLYASTDKTKSNFLFINRANNEVLKNNNTLFNPYYFYNLKICKFSNKSSSFNLNNFINFNALPANFQNQTKDYILGKNEGKKLGSISSNRDWYAWGFLGGFGLTVALIGISSDINEATKIPIGLTFTIVPYLSVDDVPDNKKPLQKSKDYLKGFSDGHKIVKRRKEMRYCFIGTVASYLLSYLLIASFGGKGNEEEEPL